MLSVAITNYYLDILFVTNKHLIDVDQLGLFSRDIATTPIHNIEDIKIEIKGILGTWFQFGNLHIQTAGASKEMIIRGIKHPQEAKDAILMAYDSSEKGVL
jgi:membrane protein YdbS with pleckstrin-like domain